MTTEAKPLTETEITEFCDLFAPMLPKSLIARAFATIRADREKIAAQAAEIDALRILVEVHQERIDIYETTAPTEAAVCQSYRERAETAEARVRWLERACNDALVYRGSKDKTGMFLTMALNCIENALTEEKDA